MSDPIETIKTLSPTVAAEHDALEAAANDRLISEADLLERVSALVAPALPALSSRIRTSLSWVVDYPSPDVETFAGYRGIYLCHDQPGPVEVKARADANERAGWACAVCTGCERAISDLVT
jgi:hypothetical protein